VHCFELQYFEWFWARAGNNHAGYKSLFDQVSSVSFAKTNIFEEKEIVLWAG